jgi:hypothetical protein
VVHRRKWPTSDADVDKHTEAVVDAILKVPAAPREPDLPALLMRPLGVLTTDVRHGVPAGR